VAFDGVESVAAVPVPSVAPGVVDAPFGGVAVAVEGGAGGGAAWGSGLRKTTVTCAVLSGSVTVTSTTNCSTPARGPVRLAAGATVPRNTYPTSVPVPMTCWSEP